MIGNGSSFLLTGGGMHGVATFSIMRASSTTVGQYQKCIEVIGGKHMLEYTLQQTVWWKVYRKG